MRRFRSVHIGLLLIALFTSVIARADSLSFTINNSTLTAAPGSTVSIAGTVTAAASNTGLVYLNGDFFNVSGGATLDDTSYLTSFPFFLGAGDSYTGTLFTLTLPSMTGVTYSGLFGILGGADANTYSTLGSANFSVTTAAVTAATPEPSSLLLCATGLVEAVVTMRRRMLSSAPQSV